MKLVLQILVVSVLLVACGSGGNEQKSENTGSGDTLSKTKSGSQKEITIEFWSSPTVINVEGIPSPQYGDYEKAMAEAFEKENPGIKVKYRLIGAADIEQAITVALSGDNQPDVAIENLSKRLIKYVSSGKVEEISDFYDTSRFNKSMLEAVTIDGKVYGLPLYDHIEVTFLNKHIFEQKGLAHLIPQDRDWTLEEMYDALKQVSGDGVYGTAFYSLNEQGDEMMLQRYFNMGGQFWSDDLSRIVVHEYLEAVEWIETMIKMVDEGTAAPGPATLQALDALELFKQGKLAMLPWGTGLYSIIEGGKKDGSVNPNVEPYAILPPHKEGLDPVITDVGAIGLVVFQQKDPEKREAVKKFVQFLSTTERIQAMAKAGGYYPAHMDATYVSDNEDLNAIYQAIEGLSFANLGYKSKAYASVRPLWFPELQAALMKHKTPQQALNDFAQNANKTIQELK